MLARAEMLSFGCGILVLDEPTAYLDKVNLPILVQVLQDADRHLRAEKLVLLVPTHEAALEPVMAKTIKL
jgi:energy-coupling factor transporter ATP-binding protein EcfA2